MNKMRYFVERRKVPDRGGVCTNESKSGLNATLQLGTRLRGRITRNLYREESGALKSCEIGMYVTPSDAYDVNKTTVYAAVYYVTGINSVLNNKDMEHHLS